MILFFGIFVVLGGLGWFLWNCYFCIVCWLIGGIVVLFYFLSMWLVFVLFVDFVVYDYILFMYEEGVEVIVVLVGGYW